MLKMYSENVVCILFYFINQYVCIFPYDALISAQFYFTKILIAIMGIWKSCIRTQTIHFISDTRCLSYNRFLVYNNSNNKIICDLLDISSGSMPATDLTTFMKIPAKQQDELAVKAVKVVRHSLFWKWSLSMEVRQRSGLVWKMSFTTKLIFPLIY